jgi:hypothetical protein
MDDEKKVLYEAISEILPYLEIPGEPKMVHTIWLSPAESLRRQADEIEKKEKAIIKLRNLHRCFVDRMKDSK